MSALEGDFAICMSLYHGLELMEQHGLRSVHNFFEEVLTTEKSYNRTRNELLRNQTFCNIMEDLKENYGKPLRQETCTCTGLKCSFITFS